MLVFAPSTAFWALMVICMLVTAFNGMRSFNVLCLDACERGDRDRPADLVLHLNWIGYSSVAGAAFLLTGIALKLSGF